MKKSLIILTLVLVSFFGQSFANDESGVNQKIVKNFRTEFAAATDVQWDVKKEFVKVKFTMNDHVLYAYYNESGERIAIVRNILSSSLPMILQSELQGKYKNYWISDLFEIAGDGTEYYVTIENADSKMVMKANGSLGWEFYKKENKE
jgi:hypothetical protein